MSDKQPFSKPPVSSKKAQSELDKAEKQFDQFHEEIKEMTLDRMNEAPKLEQEQQTRLSQNEIQKNNDLYLKPKRTINSAEKFNEKFRKDYEFAKEHVNFIAENKEIGGEHIEMWTKPFAGMPAEFWEIPVNKPIWGPRYVAEQVKKCTYHRLTMQENRVVSSDGVGSYTGQMVADNIIQRLDAHPVAARRSIFMTGSGF
jgi:hypothetical protein